MGFDNAVAFVLLNAVGLFAPIMAVPMVPSMVSANQVGEGPGPCDGSGHGVTYAYLKHMCWLVGHIRGHIN